ncbi:MAG: O-antigen ligase family protein, partial [bacterium]|nr:O-antigen ligase family protein [bacterium]
QVGLRMISDHPILGVGLNNFPEVFGKYYWTTPGISRALKLRSASHNIYIGTISELGLIGFTILAIMIYSIIKSGWIARSNLKRIGDYQLMVITEGIILSFVGLLISGFFGDVLYKKYLWLPLILIEVVRNLSTKFSSVS